MTHPNPLELARTAQSMARSSPADNAAVFNKVAMVCMGVMALASMAQVLQPIIKDLRSKDEDEKRSQRGWSR